MHPHPALLMLQGTPAPLTVDLDLHLQSPMGDAQPAALQGEEITTSLLSSLGQSEVKWTSLEESR